MLFPQDRGQARAVFQRSWRKYLDGTPLEPLEAVVVDVVLRHPEFHGVLTAQDVNECDTPAETGEDNPFLHLGLHVAVQEQIASARPPGMRELHARLVERWRDAHEAEHRMMECLLEVLRAGMAAGRAPDEARYLECVRRRAGIPR
jgi:hypothetical protein